MAVEVIEDETIEYYTDEELMNSEDIPNETGIDNSDIESFDGNESMESTEVDLRNIREKETENEEEEDENDREYTSDDEDTSNDDDTDDESKNTEEEESEEEEGNDTTESSALCVLCCARDYCEQEGGQSIIGMSHKCIVYDGRLHGFPCSNGKQKR